MNLKVNIGIVNGNELNADGVSTVNQVSYSVFLKYKKRKYRKLLNFIIGIL